MGLKPMTWSGSEAKVRDGTALHRGWAEGDTLAL